MSLILNKILKQENLTFDEMYDVMNEIIEGKISDCEIGALLMGLQIKGIVADELKGAVKVFREKALKVNNAPIDAIDTCGTGGDGLSTINISTAASIVAATAGAKVLKHGNKSVSSKSGSADVLLELGINIEQDKDLIINQLNDTNLGFMFAPNFHKAMKNVAHIRKQLGFRTIFNMIGPLVNPANVQRQLIGVYDEKLTYIYAQVLKDLGSKRVMIVHGEDGLDEISISGSTKVSEIIDQKIITYTIKPEDFNLKIRNIKEIKGGSSKENANLIIDVFEGEKGAKRDVILINAAAIIYLSGLASSINDGIKIAAKVIDNGEVIKQLEKIKSYNT